MDQRGSRQGRRRPNAAAPADGELAPGRDDLLDVLRGPDAGALLRQALSASGVTVHSWELDQVYARPGAEVSAKYRLHCTAPAASRAAEPALRGQPLELAVVASTVELTEGQRRRMGAVRADSAHGSLHLWVHPVDPELPGLQVVERPSAPREALSGPTELEDRLSRLLGEVSTVQAVELLVLRPLRRAVYRATVTSGRGQRVLYLKVVRPARVGLLLRRHRGSPLIPTTADAGDGIMVLEEASGVALTRLLFAPTAEVAPLGPGVALSALDTLDPSALSLPARVPPAQRLDPLTESAIIAGADPLRVRRLCAAIRADLRAAPGAVVPTHGDFHPANLFLDAGGQRPAALIDADTLGPGYRVDDLATMLGHLVALPSFDAAGYAVVPDFARRFHARCLQEAEPVDLGARTASVLLSLLPGTRGPEQREHCLRWAEKLVGRLSPQDLLR